MNLELLILSSSTRTCALFLHAQASILQRHVRHACEMRTCMHSHCASRSRCVGRLCGALLQLRCELCRIDRVDALQ
eukprot:490-Pleurochrysis_carterae.AAC.1